MVIDYLFINKLCKICMVDKLNCFYINYLNRLRKHSHLYILLGHFQ